MRKFLRLLATLTLLAAPLSAPPALAQDSGMSLLEEAANATSDQDFITRLITGALSDTGRSVVIEGFDGALSSRATIERIVISDAEGVWLVLSGVVLDWDRSALLRKRIEVGEMSAEVIRLVRPPVASADAPAPESTPFRLPDLPVSVEIETISAGEVVLGEAVLGEEASFSLDGTLSLVDGEGEARILANRLGGEGGFAIRGSYSNETRVLGLTVSLEEGEGGIVAGLLNLPGDPALQLELTGTGPLDDYSADLTLATDGEPRVTGTFGLVTVDGASQLRADVSGDVTALVPPQYVPFFGPDSRIALQGRREADGALILDSLTAEAETLDLTASGALQPDGWPVLLHIDGSFGAADGGMMLLPFSGGGIEARRAEIALDYDQAEGDAFTLAFTAEDYTQAGIDIGALRLEGSGAISPAAETFSAELRYGAEGLVFADAALSEAVGPEISGEIALAQPAEGPLEISRLTLTGPGLELSGSAAVDTASERLQSRLDLALEAGDLSRFAALAGTDLTGAAALELGADIALLDRAGRITLEGTTEGLGIGVPELDGLFSGDARLQLTAARDGSGTRIEALNLRSDGVVLVAEANISSASATGDFSLTLPDLSRALPELSGPGTFSGTARWGAASGAEISADLAADIVSADIDVVQDSEGWRGTILAAVADLAPFSDLAGRPLTGAIDLDIEGRAASDFSTYEGRLDGTTEDLSIGIAALDPLLAGTGRLAARVTGREGEITFETLSALTDELALQASGTLAGEDLDAEFSARLDDLGLLAPGLDGPATAEGEARLAGGGIDVTADITAPGGLGGDLRLLREGESGPLSVDARLAVPDLAPFSDLAGLPLGGAAEITATGALPEGGERLEIAVSGTTQDIAIGIPQVDALLAGPGRIAATIVREGDALSAEGIDIATETVALTGSAARAGDGALSADLSATLQPGALPGSNGGGEPLVVGLQGGLAADRALDLTVSARAGSNRLRATAAGPFVAGDWQLDTSLTLDAPELAALAGPFGLPFSGRVTLDASGSVQPNALTFAQEVNASASNLGLGSPLVNSIFAGTGTLTASVARGADGLITSDGVALRFPNLTVNGAVRQEGDGGSADFDARLADIGLLAPGFSGPLSATGAAELSGGAWTISADVDGPGGLGARIAGSYGPAGAVDVSATGQLPLGLANAFIEPRRLDGTASFDLALTGTSLDALSGTVTLNGARLSLPTFTLAVEGISGTVSLGGGRADLALAGGISTGGTLEIGGSVGLSGGFDAAIRATANDLILRDPALYEARLSAAISIDGPLTGGARITGRADLAEAEIRVPSSPIGPLGDLPTVRHINAPATVATTLDRAELTLAGTETGGEGGAGGGAAYGLDITLSAPSRIFVRGRGLDAELGGELRLTGTTANIIPTGAFELQRGRLDLLGQRFDLDEGSVTLQGNFDPYLRLVARTEAPNGTVVTITVEGPALEPDVTFDSEPSLPQDEVLSQLLFGTSIADISPLQAVQLASAVSTLAGRGGVGVLGRLRMGLGLDDLDVQTDEEGNTAIQAGKYISENIYADITLGDETAVTLNLDVTDNVTVRGGVSSDGESRLGVFYELDY
ncbi:translocation/assembly module TamB domain-containing protein [Pseudoroseicyclus sp. CXY001]|uniref:translocation/assembly module TamB domain-containing protein n=1 Tax=Pseudoroseicyclus sp. CXY001 TaxID=3242492 RepID=UPI003571122B